MEDLNKYLEVDAKLSFVQRAPLYSMVSHRTYTVRAHAHSGATLSLKSIPGLRLTAGHWPGRGKENGGWDHVEAM